MEPESAPSPEGAPITLEVDAGAPPAPESAAPGRRLLWRQFPFVVVGAVVIALLVKSFLLQAFYIPSTSMLPTLERGDRVLVEKVGRLFGGPARGDVVVFERDIAASPPQETGSPMSELADAFKGLLGMPADGREDLIKRVIAVEGDVVEGQGQQVLVNGDPLDEDYLLDGSATYTFAATTVQPGMIFVMGDNRDGSQDSRSFGQVPVDRVVGKAILVIWPLNRAGPI
ncbi:MAG TPA: signal peptidase I [Actinomycetota bacterium]|nr:signal peptidase I [Actinomycetota bacterium]